MTGLRSGAPPGEERTGPVDKSRPPEKNLDRDADNTMVRPTDDVPVVTTAQKSPSRATSWILESVP